MFCSWTHPIKSVCCILTKKQHSYYKWNQSRAGEGLNEASSINSL